MSYLICKKCKSYYKLRHGEKPEDYSNECECGGKLKFTKNFKTDGNDWDEFLIEGVCQFCGRENPKNSNYCAWCGKKINSQIH